jgi:hypothetical protein
VDAIPRRCLLSSKTLTVHASDGIALGAATIATFSLGWQVLMYRSGRKVRLKVDLELVHYLAHDLENPKKVDELFPSDDWELTVSVLNDSDRAIHISTVAIEYHKDESEIVSWQPESWRLPWKLEPRENRLVSIDHELVGVISKGASLQAKAFTSTGKIFSSHTIEVGGSESDHQYVAILEDQMKEIERTTGVRMYKYRIVSIQAA